MPAHSAHLESGQGGRFGSWPIAPRVRGRARAGRRGYFAGSDGKKIFPWPSLPPKNSIPCHFFFSFSRLLRGEKSSSWLQLFDADCEITRHFSSRPHAEELKRAPARVPLKKQRRAFFSVVEVARPLARSRASLLSPLSLFLFLRAISLSFLIFFLSRAKGIRSHLVLTAIESSIQQKKNSGSECPSLGRRGASPGSRSRRARPRPRARDQQRLRLYYAHLVVVCRGAPVGPTGARE